MTAFEYKLPDVGEGLVEAEIVNWKVKPGDTVKVNDIIVEIETAKSLVELPSPYAGTIGDLLVPEGQVVPVGTPIVAIAVAGAPAGAPPPRTPESRSSAAAKVGGSDGGEEQAKTLVGYGPKASSTRRRPRRGAGGTTNGDDGVARAEAQDAMQGAMGVEPEPAVAQAPAQAPVPAPAKVSAPAQPVADGPVLAKPPVRKLAKDLGIDLRSVPPTGPGGTITRSDVESFREAEAAGGSSVQVTPRAPGERETRVPIRGVRRATAENVTRSAFTVPHVTEWVTVDVTATMEVVDRLRTRRELADVKVNPLLLVAKAVMLAVPRTPEINAMWDEAAGEIVLKHYVNLGIAAATPRGLLVPNIKDADQLRLPELAHALSALVQTARDGKSTPSDMQDTTFTITNVGVFGVEAGTPILNPGTTGILAVGAIRKRPWVVAGADGEERIAPRWVTTLALSFDHRVVDGEQGSRFLTDVAGLLEDPALSLLVA